MGLSFVTVAFWLRMKRRKDKTMKKLNQDIQCEVAVTERKLTFRELKSRISPTGSGKLPTYKQLVESGSRIFMRRRVDADTDLTVYENGFALYEKQTGEDEVTTTVFGVDRCGGITYDAVEKMDKLDASVFEDEDCMIRLVMEGEERIFENRERSHRRFHDFSVEGDGSDWSVAADSHFEDDIADADEDAQLYRKVREGMGRLTDRQRKVVTMYVVQGMKQQEIADKLGISQQVVDRTIKAGLRNLKKFF